MHKLLAWSLGWYGCVILVLWFYLVQTTLKAFKKTDFTSVREHEEFVWLHDRFVENEDYAGIIVSYYHQLVPVLTNSTLECGFYEEFPLLSLSPDPSLTSQTRL